jgi:hypothetical protein
MIIFPLEEFYKKRLYHKRARIYDMMQGACGGLYFTASNRSRNLRKPCPSG